MRRQMALKACPRCGKMAEAFASNCDNCGFGSPQAAKTRQLLPSTRIKIFIGVVTAHILCWAFSLFIIMKFPAEPVHTDNLGMVMASSSSQSAPGDPKAIQVLATAVTGNPDKQKFRVVWQNGYPSGTVYRRQMEYFRQSKTLVEATHGGSRYRYGGVTGEHLSSLANQAQGRYVSTEDLVAMGCTKASIN